MFVLKYDWWLLERWFEWWTKEMEIVWSNNEYVDFDLNLQKFVSKDDFYDRLSPSSKAVFLGRNSFSFSLLKWFLCKIYLNYQLVLTIPPYFIAWLMSFDSQASTPSLLNYLSEANNHNDCQTYKKLNKNHKTITNWYTKTNWFKTKNIIKSWIINYVVLQRSIKKLFI